MSNIAHYLCLAIRARFPGLVLINTCREMPCCLGLLHNGYKGEALEEGIFSLVISSFLALIPDAHFVYGWFTCDLTVQKKILFLPDSWILSAFQSFYEAHRNLSMKQHLSMGVEAWMINLILR